MTESMGIIDLPQPENIVAGDDEFPQITLNDCITKDNQNRTVAGLFKGQVDGISQPEKPILLNESRKLWVLNSNMNFDIRNQIGLAFKEILNIEIRII